MPRKPAFDANSQTITPPRPNERRRKPKCELDQSLWALIDGRECFMTNLTYDKAEKKLKDFPDATIVTCEAAARLVATDRIH